MLRPSIRVLLPIWLAFRRQSFPRSTNGLRLGPTPACSFGRSLTSSWTRPLGRSSRPAPRLGASRSSR
eukprot:6548507-Alexandrium_andersonii.AAC.1